MIYSSEDLWRYDQKCQWSCGIYHRESWGSGKIIGDANNEILLTLKNTKMPNMRFKPFNMKFKVLVENQLKALDEVTEEE